MSLRAIDISAMTAPETVSAGAVPELRWIEIDALRIDDAYQRPIRWDNVRAINKIAAGFNWSMFTPVVVAPVIGGQYALIDGQHRTHAARLAGFSQVPAMVVVAPEAGQAAAFAAINGTVTAVSALNLYRAALVAGAPWARRCEAAVTAAGCRLLTVNKSSRSRAPRELVCVGLIRDHITKDRDALVTAVLAGIAAKPDVTKDHFTEKLLTPFLMALSRVLAEAPGAAVPELTSFCARHDLVTLFAKVSRLVGEPPHAGLSLRELMTRSLAALLKAHLAIPTAAVPAPLSSRPCAVSGPAPDEASLGAAMAREARESARIRARRGARA